MKEKQTIVREDFANLKKRGLVEGRYPNIYVSYEIANLTGGKADYERKKGFGDDVYKKMIVETLKSLQKATLAEIVSAVGDSLPANLDNKQKSRKVSNILQSLKSNQLVDSEGAGRGARWFVS